MKYHPDVPKEGLTERQKLMLHHIACYGEGWLDERDLEKKMKELFKQRVK